MKKQLEIGIIGCSSIGMRVVIPAIKESNSCKLGIIGSRSTKKAKNTALKFKSRKFGNYNDVIEDKEIDLIYISLPIGLQEYWAIKAAKAGKHVLCEKSISTSHTSSKKIWKEFKKNNVKIEEAFSYRYHPQHTFVKKILKNNNLGVIHNFSTTFLLPIIPSRNNFRFNKKLGGGILNDVGCYTINGSRYFLEEEPISVTCKLFRNKKFNIDIKGSITMSFNNEKTSFGLIGYDNEFFSDYRIFCKKGVVISNKPYNTKKSETTEIHISSNKNKIKKITKKNQSKLMIEEFCKEIKLKKHVLSTEIINQSKVMEAARISNIKNKTVFLSDLQ